MIIFFFFIFSDETKDAILAKSKFVLIDHNKPVSTKIRSENVILIFDHHEEHEIVNIHRLGKKFIRPMIASSASMIADIVYLTEEVEKYMQVLRLLRGAIIKDIGYIYDRNADERFPYDWEVLKKIEASLRKRLYDELIWAERDVSGLNSIQLLHKDIKMVSNHDHQWNVAIPFFPITIDVSYRKLVHFGNL